MQRARDYISYTQIDTYLRCPLLYKYAYIEDHPRPPTKALIFGRAVHHALHEYGKYYMSTGYHNEKLLFGLWSLACEDSTVAEMPLPFDDFRKGGDMLVRLLEGSKLDFSNALELEHEFLLELGGVNVRGVIDRVDKLGEGVYRAVDYKTGGSIYSGDDVSDSLQLSIYAAALEKMLGEEARFISVAIHQINQNVFIEREKSYQDIEDAVRYIADIYARIKGDSEMPATPGEACLRYGGCWAAHLCPEHQNVELDGLDLAQVSGQELLKLYTHVEMQHKLVSDALKGKLEEEDQIAFGGRIASFDSGNRYVAKNDELWTLIQDFDLDPLAMSTFDIRKFKRVIEQKRQDLMHSDGDEDEKDFMLERLDQLSADAYDVVASKPRLSIRKE